MDAKAEKIALFRYGLIATLLEKLPRGEMIRRARELAEHDYDIRFPIAGIYRWKRCCIGPRVTGLAVWRHAAAFGSRKTAGDLPAVGATDRTAQTRESAPQRHDIAARAGAGVGRRNGTVIGKLVVPILNEKWPDQAPTVDQERIQEV